jgi:hypothetical protein
MNRARPGSARRVSVREKEPEEVLEWCAELTIKSKLCDRITELGHWKKKTDALKKVVPEKKATTTSLVSLPTKKHLKFVSHHRRQEKFLGTVRSVVKELFTFSGQRNFVVQVRVIFYKEFIRGLCDSMTIYKLAETVMLGVVSGCVWFQKGSQDTLTPLNECIGLMFFTTALFTVPPIFAALTATEDIVRRIKHEYLSGVCNIFASVTGLYLSWFFTFCVWPPLWQVIAYSFADLGPTLEKMLTMHVILILNVLTMRTLGLFLALWVPLPALNVVIGNTFAQLCMLTNGFYTKLPSWFQPLTVISVPRYTLRALLKLEFSWRDTFRVHPMRGSAAHGFPTEYIPAELTGTFQTIAEREMDIMSSPEDSTVVPELLVLGLWTLCFSFLFTIGLFVTIWKEQAMSEELDVSSWRVEEPWMNDGVGVDGAVAGDNTDLADELQSEPVAPVLKNATPFREGMRVGKAQTRNEECEAPSLLVDDCDDLVAWRATDELGLLPHATMSSEDMESAPYDQR